MKKTFSVLVLTALASFAFAQAAAPAAPAAGPDQTQAISDLTDRIAALEGRESAVEGTAKTLDGKLKFAGYMLGAATINTDDSQVRATDLLDTSYKTFKNTFFRLNLSYATPAGGFNGRIEVQPTAQFSLLATANLAEGTYTALRIGYAYLNFWDNQIQVQGGVLKEDNPNNFDIYYAAAQNTDVKFLQAPDLTSGDFASQSSGFETLQGYYNALGLQLVLTPAMVSGLKLGVIVPAAASGTAATGATGPYTIDSNAIFRSNQYNAAYFIPNYGAVKAGFQGRTANSGGPNNGVDSLYYGVEFRPKFMYELKDLYVAAQVAQQSNNDFANVVTNVVYGTLGWNAGLFDLPGLYLADDTAVVLDKDSNAGWSNNFLIRYTFKAVLPGLDIAPQATFGYYGGPSTISSGYTGGLSGLNPFKVASQGAFNFIPRLVFSNAAGNVAIAYGYLNVSNPTSAVSSAARNYIAVSTTVNF